MGNERRILVSELSGRSNIMALTSGLEIQQDRELMDRILARASSNWRIGAISSRPPRAPSTCWCASAPAVYQPHFDRLHYRINVETDATGRVVTEATVKLRVESDVRHEVAEGDGPVNALDAALRKALADAFRICPACSWSTTKCA